MFKIAFNYLAKWIPVDKRQFLLDSAFDEVRHFARSGTAMPPGRFSVASGNEHSVLRFKENIGIRAHVLVLEYSPDGALCCRFSPYDYFHYSVVLAEKIERILEPIGHIFLFGEPRNICQQLGNRLTTT